MWSPSHQLGALLEMHILRPHPRPVISEAPEVGPGVHMCYVLTSLPGHSNVG